MLVRAHRGNTLAAGVVVLTAFVVEAELRLDLDDGPRLALTAGLALLAGVLGLASPVQGGRPRTYQELLHAITTLAATAAAVHLAAVLGASLGDGPAAGTVAWVAAVGALCGLAQARARDATLALLLGTVLAIVALLAAAAALWPGDDPLAGVRWMLVAVLVLLVGAILVRFDRRYRHAVVLADVLGVAVVLLSATFLVRADHRLADLLGVAPGSGGAGGGWELLLLACGFGLVGLGSAAREQGPGWLGAIGLVAALLVVARGGGGLVGWPLVLLVVGAALVAIALRPVEREVPADPEEAAGLERAPAVVLPVRPVVLPPEDDER
ncbi:hypothetical protein [Patulibacter defluvii]|uniref:hypothetical protein n=1 Tax=Patulibacter defluvii TaxID=3095358 RepID=UPI002A756EB4|nr:hypothetical protein [Patulibacter sp. DM4]